MILNIPEFIAKAHARNIDPFPLIARLGRELAKLNEYQREELFLLPTQPKSFIEDGEPFFPCGWCKQDNGTWNPWCGWWHWWVCGWPGFNCIDCGTDPPPE